MSAEIQPRLIQEALVFKAKKDSAKTTELARKEQALELWERARSLLLASGAVCVQKSPSLARVIPPLAPINKGKLELTLGEGERSVEVSIRGTEHFSQPGKEFTKPFIDIKVGELSSLSLPPNKNYYKPDGVWDIPDSDTLEKYVEILTTIEYKLGIRSGSPKGSV